MRSCDELLRTCPRRTCRENNVPARPQLAVDGVPVAVTCRVLKIARQPYYRWLKCPVTDAELDEAYLANAIFDAHRDDPEFGYRFLADEVRAGGHGACDRTVWRHCTKNGWWSEFDGLIWPRGAGLVWPQLAGR